MVTHIFVDGDAYICVDGEAHMRRGDKLIAISVLGAVWEAVVIFPLPYIVNSYI